MTELEEVRNREKALLKKTESDAALIESLNRYIEALEGKAAHQLDTIKDLKKQLKELLVKPKTKISHKKNPAPKP